MRIINTTYITIHWERVRRSSSGINVADYKSNYCSNAIQLKSGTIESHKRTTLELQIVFLPMRPENTAIELFCLMSMGRPGSALLYIRFYLYPTISILIDVVRWTIINIEWRLSPVILRIGLRNSLFTNLFSEPHT